MTQYPTIQDIHHFEVVLREQGKRLDYLFEENIRLDERLRQDRRDILAQEFHLRNADERIRQLRMRIDNLIESLR